MNDAVNVPKRPPNLTVFRLLSRVFGAAAFSAVACLCACGSDNAPAAGNEKDGFEVNRTPANSEPWQPFTQGSVWNLRLPAQRTEVALPAAGLAVAPFATSDSDYGIKVYFASAADPTWMIAFDDYNTATDDFSQESPVAVRAPAQLVQPTGTDGTVIVVDENRRFAYEMWRFSVTRAAGASGSPQGRSASVNVIDLRGDGIHRNVGVTASGLPGIGGVLRSLEVQKGQPIRHKLWLAVHPDLLNAAAVWPANHFDVPKNGAHAALNYGDVVALSQSYDVKQGECNLSPLFQNLARGLQDFGGIVQDRGGDSIGIVSEVGAVATALDVNEAAMYTQLACLRKYLVRIDDPWTGAAAGGLGY